MSDYNKDNNNSSFDPSWLLIVIAFAVFWPVGVGLLIYKLSQSAKVRETKNDWVDALGELGQRHAGQQVQQEAKQAAQDTKQEVKQTVQEVKDGLHQVKQELHRERHEARQAYHQTQRTSSNTRPEGTVPQPTGRRSPKSLKGGGFLTVLGGILAICCGAATCQLFFAGMLGSPWFALQNAIVPFICTGVGFGLFAWGRIKHRHTRRLRKMLNMVGRQKRIDIRALAKAFPTSYSKACDDIQDLIDGGYLGKNAYINMTTGELILDSDGFQSAPKPQQTPVQKQDQDQQLLAEIHRVNDAIPGEEMSRKIYRIEECTQHILDYLKKHPEKSTELHTFLDYYLPTTLKILNAYAELDQQGIQGENVIATKGRIEAMMDNVVEGFEAQLDKLFEGDMIDISADIAVMEKMLSRDGLAGSMKIPKPDPVPQAPDVPQAYTPTLTLNPDQGGAAFQTAPDQESQG